MKDYNEIAKRVLKRRDQYEEARKIKKQNVVQISTAVVCLVVVSVIGFGIGRRNWLKTQIAELMPFLTENDLQIGGDTTGTPTTAATTTKAPSLTTNPHTHATTTTAANELYYEIDWDRKSMPGKFPSVGLNSANYINMLTEPGYSGSAEYVYPFGPFEERATTRQATEFISDMQIVGHEPDGTAHETVVDIFSLEGLSEDLAIGVRFENDDRIFTYVNSSYRPETLGEFLEAIDYDNTVTYGGIMLYPGNNFPVNDENAKDIKSYLLSDASLTNIMDADAEAAGNCVIASIYCRELGRENKVFRIWENGLISTNLIGYEYSFYVGKEAVANFLKDSYNITFEQIREITAVTTNTTEPYTSDTNTAVNEDTTEIDTTTSLPTQPPAVADVTTASNLTSADETATTSWFCGTGLAESETENAPVSTTSETTTE